MEIPNFINSKAIDENGYFTSEWQNLLTQLITALQINVGNEGYVLPAQSTANIAKLTDANKSNGALVRDSDTGLPMYNQNGTWKTVTIT